MLLLFFFIVWLALFCSIGLIFQRYFLIWVYYIRLIFLVPILKPYSAFIQMYILKFFNNFFFECTWFWKISHQERFTNLKKKCSAMYLYSCIKIKQHQSYSFITNILFSVGYRIHLTSMFMYKINFSYSFFKCTKRPGTLFHLLCNGQVH